MATKNPFKSFAGMGPSEARAAVNQVLNKQTGGSFSAGTSSYGSHPSYSYGVSSGSSPGLTSIFDWGKQKGTAGVVPSVKALQSQSVQGGGYGVKSAGSDRDHRTSAILKADLRDVDDAYNRATPDQKADRGGIWIPGAGNVFYSDIVASRGQRSPAIPQDRAVAPGDYARQAGSVYPSSVRQQPTTYSYGGNTFTPAAVETMKAQGLLPKDWTPTNAGGDVFAPRDISNVTSSPTFGTQGSTTITPQAPPAEPLPSAGPNPYADLYIPEVANRFDAKYQEGLRQEARNQTESAYTTQKQQVAEDLSARGILPGSGQWTQAMNQLDQARLRGIDDGNLSSQRITTERASQVDQFNSSAQQALKIAKATGSERWAMTALELAIKARDYTNTEKNQPLITRGLQADVAVKEGLVQPTIQTAQASSRRAISDADLAGLNVQLATKLQPYQVDSAKYQSEALQLGNMLTSQQLEQAKQAAPMLIEQLRNKGVMDDLTIDKLKVEVQQNRFMADNAWWLSVLGLVANGIGGVGTLIGALK